jgi:putative NIF3 family GTP cyclohydrolase 1 type 2
VIRHKKENHMQAQAVLADFQAVAPWVCWQRTVDRFYAGDPQAEVTGIAAMWAATNAALTEAARRGLNLVICHEPPFYELMDAQGRTGDLIREKAALLDRLGLTLIRCHDTWDRMPGVGIVDSWVTALGFPSPQRSVESFYRVCLIPGWSAREVAHTIAARLRPFGQDNVHLLGNPEKQVHRLVVGTGAICRLTDMLALDADAAVMTDDGMNYWNTGIWALDADIPLFVVNHATAEIPGMQAMARYLAARYAALPVAFIADGFPPHSVSAA